MIAAIVLNIVLHAQMTVPWIGGTVPAAASVSTSVLPVLILSDIVLIPADQIEVLP
jgi:hypothetical protein